MRFSHTRQAAIAACMFAAAIALLQGCPAPQSPTAGTPAPEKSPALVSVEKPIDTPPAASADEAEKTATTLPVESPVNDAVGTLNTAPPGDTQLAAADDAVLSPVRHHPSAPADNTKTDAAKFPPLFVDWPKPEFTLFFTGRQHGYIEPCGCTGLSNQKGGLNRRKALFDDLQKQGWNPVAFDLGNQVRRFGRQPEIMFQTTINGLKKIGYQAIGYGPDDLRVSSSELLSAMIGSDSKPAPFVSANVNVLGQTEPFRVIEVAGRKIGVTSILGKAEQRAIAGDDIELKDPEAALAAIVPKLLEQKCDFYVLLSQTNDEEAARLAKKFPQFDLIATAGSAGEPAHRLIPVEGTKTQLVQVGTKGMYVSVVGVFADAKDRFVLQRVPLDGRFPDSRDMLALMASYQQELEALGLDGLEVKAQPHPSGRTYVGSATCADCHEREYDIWKASPHAHASDSIVHPTERSDIPRHHDPECLSCHVTGWNPQEYFPYESGYLSIEKSRHLMQSGCENCHGPGSQHVAAENGDIDGLTDDKIAAIRQQMVLKLSDARNKCLECHDLDNSPAFHAEGAFEKYWKRIEH